MQKQCGLCVGHGRAQFVQTRSYEEEKEVWGCESPQGGCELSDIFLPCPFLFSCLF